MCVQFLLYFLSTLIVKEPAKKIKIIISYKKNNIDSINFALRQIIHLGDFTKLDVTLEQSKTILIQMKQKAINGGDIPPSSEDTREERLLKK